MNQSIKTLLCATSVILVAGGAFFIFQFTRKTNVPIPDEKSAAMELLTEKLSGPRYFNLPVNGNREPNGPWIGVEDISLQIDRVVSERHWSMSQRSQMDRLISQLAEPRPSRAVGGYRIQLERLNLALDGIKE